MDQNSEQLNGLRDDILREIANIGAGHAASALSALLGRPVVQSVPEVRFVPLQELAETLGGAEKLVAAGLLSLSGDFSGSLLMVLDFAQAEKMISMVKGSPADREEDGTEIFGFSAMDQSVLSETINIMGGAYLTAISEFTGLAAVQSVPYLCIDMVGAVISVPAAESGKTGDYAVLFQSELFNDTERIMGDLFLIPNADSCDLLLKALGFM